MKRKKQKTKRKGGEACGMKWGNVAGKGNVLVRSRHFRALRKKSSAGGMCARFGGSQRELALLEQALKHTHPEETMRSVQM